jgi:thiamine transport system permease protein
VVRILGSTSSTTLEVEIWRETIILGRIDRGVVLAVIQLVMLAIGIGVWIVTRRRSDAFQSGSRQPISLRGRLVVAGSCLLVSAPIIALIQGSFRVNGSISTSGWRNLLSNSIRPGLRLGFDPVQAILVSLVTATFATAFALTLAVLIVAAVASSPTIGRVVDGVAMLPLGISAVTLGLGLLITFDVPPFDWRASSLMTPLGHALIATPFVVRPVVGALATMNRQQVDAAATLGARPIRSLADSIIPVVTVPLLSGAGLAVAISLGEFGATSMLSRSGGETLPIVIERLLTRTGGDFRARAYGLSLILASATMGIVIALETVANRKQR